MVSDGKSRDQLSTREKKGNLRKVVFWQIETFLVSKEDFFFFAKYYILQLFYIFIEIV
jgi:hypothetical protein